MVSFENIWNIKSVEKPAAIHIRFLSTFLSEQQML